MNGRNQYFQRTFYAPARAVFPKFPLLLLSAVDSRLANATLNVRHERRGLFCGCQQIARREFQAELFIVG